MSVSLFYFYFYFFDFIPSNNVIMLIPCFSWDFYGIRIWVETTKTHTHSHSEKLSFYLFYSIPYHTSIVSYRFIFFLLIFFRCVLLCVSLVTTCLVQFLIIVDSFYTIFDWDIRMRIVSILFDLIFAYFLTCFQNKVLSCLIRRQSFVFSYLPANQPASQPAIQASSLHK